MFFPAAVIITGAFVLIPLSPLLIFGLGPFPHLGIAGGAAAVLLYYVAGCVDLRELYLVPPRSAQSFLNPAAPGLGTDARHPPRRRSLFDR